jgi:hypothetical protein
VLELWLWRWPWLWWSFAARRGFRRLVLLHLCLHSSQLLLQSQRCMELCEDGRGAEGALAAEGTVAVQLVKEVGFGALMAQCGRGVAESVDIPKIASLEFEHDPDDPDAAAATDEDALFAWLSLFSAAHNEFGAALATVATR